MSRLDCAAVRELIPDLAAGRAGPGGDADLERHLAGCAECARELELVRLVLADRPSVPEGLAARIVQALRADRRPASRTWWGLSAAAIAALALGIGIASEDAPSGPGLPPVFASEVEEGALWVSDDGLVAGAPMLDGLSDEALTQLLDELSERSAGGSA